MNEEKTNLVINEYLDKSTLLNNVVFLYEPAAYYCLRIPTWSSSLLTWRFN